jgi:hypothetical protein
MSSETRSKRVIILENVTHYFTALVVVLLKGFDKIDHGKAGVGIVFIVIGIIIVSGTLLHHKADKILRHFNAYVFALEAIVMAIIGYMYAQEGKQFIQYVCYFASAMFVVALAVYLKRSKSEINLS